MSKTRKREAKLKSRERQAKTRVAARREVIRKEAKKHRIIARQEKALGEKGVTIVGEEKRDAYNRQREQVVNNKLERNLAALQAIVAEMDAEDATRKEVNEKLESLGHHTLEEKIRAMAEMSKSLIGEDLPSEEELGSGE